MNEILRQDGRIEKVDLRRIQKALLEVAVEVVVMAKDIRDMGGRWGDLRSFGLEGRVEEVKAVQEELEKVGEVLR